MISLYQVFYDMPARAGNLVTVAVDSNEHPARSSFAAAHCKAARLESNEFQVECFQHDHKIQCCGHGLLATAYALFASSDCHQLNFGGGISAERSCDADGSLHVSLILPSLAVQSIKIPAWAQLLLATEGGTGVPPIAAAASRAVDGYLLIQLDSQELIENMKVDTDAICVHTQQAVLIWQRDVRDTALIKTRYFAPQYGNREDSATGSVLRVLGPYVERVAGLSNFEVIQCSPEGGRMTVGNRGASVAVGGNVRMINAEELPAKWQR